MTIDGVVYDIKGNEIRVYNNDILGTKYREIVLDLFNNTIIEPSKIQGNGKCKGEDAYEIEKPCHENHYIKQFNKITKDEQTSLISQLLQKLNIEGDTEQLALEVFENNTFNQQILIKIIVRDMFEKTIGDSTWIITGDGTNVKIITKKNFDKIKIGKDFFRIATSNKIGWYIK